MRTIIIGAGRGMRLEDRTALIPKTMVEVMGRPMLEWILEALAHAGIQPSSVVFVGGYAQEVIETAHPEFTFLGQWTNGIIGPRRASVLGNGVAYEQPFLHLKPPQYGQPSPAIPAPWR